MSTTTTQEEKAPPSPPVSLVEQEDKIVPLATTTKVKKASEEKWGRAVMQFGFCIIPSLLLRGQQRLGLNPTQLAVLLQLCDYWWENARKPYPSKEKIATRLKLSPRQVQRYIAELEKAGFVMRVPRFARNGGKLTNIYDLSGLVRKLEQIEPEFRQVEEAAKLAREDVKKSGYRQRKSMQPPPKES